MGRISRRERLRAFCIWKVAVPAALLALMYPIYRFIFELEHPFVRAFAQCDLLLFSGLLLMEAAEESRSVKMKRGPEATHMIRAVALLVLFLFGVMRNDALSKEHQLMGGAAAAQPKLESYAGLNCLAAIVTVLFVFWLLWWREESEARKALAKLVRGGEV